jgi:glycine/D-amino acid oxidase-like deaminating enzyme
VPVDQQQLRIGEPLWLRRTRPLQRYRSLAGAHEARVAIIGGGITGALIANAFAAEGVSTILLEAELVGRGSTAASSALLLQEPDLELLELTKRYGSKASRRIWEISRNSVAELVRTLHRMNVRCDLEARDAFYYATDAKSNLRLLAEYEHRARLGFGGSWLDAGPLRRATGISGYGAIRTKGNAQFDPYRACAGLMRAAKHTGARIFERSRVRRIITERNGVRLLTKSGSVECERVIVATGYATPEFRPLSSRFRMFRTYVIETESLTMKQRRELGLSNVMIWDTDRPYHYARWAGHRLLLGGGDRLVRHGGARRPLIAAATGELREHFQRQFPALADVEITSAWEGLFAMTPDSLPYIGPHRLYPRHWFALGYGGNGMTFAALAARLLVERWRGNVSADHALFEFGRRPKSGRRVRGN